MSEAAERKPTFRSLARALALIWVGFAVYAVLQCTPDRFDQTFKQRDNPLAPL